jgi:plasmid replication initiation protein
MFDANLAINQLGYSSHRLNVMIGAKNFVQSREDNYVSFRFTCKAKNKANYCKITLNPSDTYILEFGYIRGLNYTIRSVNELVYCDQLTRIFETETGLNLSI